MKSNFLFPNKYKRAGWLLLLPTLVIGFLSIVYSWEPALFDWQMPAIMFDGILSENRFFGLADNNFFAEFLAILIILSGLLVAFAKEKVEDEYIAKIRLESLVWATIVNYAILLFAIIFIFDIAFFWFMVINMFTLILFFIVRFNWLVYKLRKTENHEE